jgi:hypothetical protein
MYLDDNKDKCTIYDRSFQDDLYPFSYDNFSIKFDKGFGEFVTVKVDASSRPRQLIEEIAKRTYGEKLPENQWFPVFIDNEVSAQNINNRTLFRGTPDPSDALGIENIMSFSADSDIFRSWDITNGDMTIDWILTSPLLPFVPKYGLLCWYYYNPDATIARLDADPVSIENVSYNTVVQMLEDYSYPGVDARKNTKWIKKDSDTFYAYDKTIVTLLDSEEILPLETSRFFKLSKYLNENPKKKIEDIKFSIVGDEFDAEKGHREIYIPQGEVYSYFNSEEEMSETYRGQYTGFSRTYLSPTLFPVYREVYHSLTAHFERDPNSLQNSAEYNGFYSDEFGSSIGTDGPRLFHKICYFLSTHPLMDRTSINILSNEEFYYILSNAINSYKFGNDINKEIVLIFNILTDMSNKLSNLIGPTKTSVDSSNIARSSKDLFSILSRKYGIKLKLKDTAKLKYKTSLKHGPHIKINQDIVSKCSKLIRNTSVFNNIEIRTPPYIAKSDIAEDHSLFKLITTQNDGKTNSIDIPLWDVEKTKIKDVRLPVTAGPDIEIDFNDEKYFSKESKNENGELLWKEIYFQIDKASIPRSDPTNPNILGGEDPVIEWSLLSGSDCLRFSNDSLSTSPGANREFRYRTSQDYNPIIYIKKPGRYSIQLKIITSFGIIFDNVTIHIINKIERRDLYDRAALEPIELLAPEKIQYIEAKDNLAVMLPNIRECAIGKQGVFWPSYSDCSVRYPKTNGFPFIQSFGDPLHKFSFPTYKDKPKNFDTKSSSLEIVYQCNNTNIYLNRIILSNMMDNNEECYQCQSFYRGIVDNYGFYLDAGVSSDKQLLDKDGKLVTIPGPSNLSTKRTTVKSYGGFPGHIVNQLGINIPDHPEPGVILKLISSSGNIPNNDSKSKINYACHHTLLDYKSELEFNKGFFHPKYGWLDTSKEENKTFTNETICDNFNLPKYSEYSFKGAGFSDLSNTDLKKSAIYRSSIEISKDPLAQSVVIPEGATDEERIDIIKNHEKMEVDDHDKIYGYRSTAGEFGKSLIDSDMLKTNFTIQQDIPDNVDNYCVGESENINKENTSVSYAITQPGPYDLFKTIDGINYRFDRKNRSPFPVIYYPQIKLNFLNYFNPKELIVWLEVKTCSKVAYELNPPPKEGGSKPRAKDPWSYSHTFSSNFENSLSKNLYRNYPQLYKYINNIYTNYLNSGDFENGFDNIYKILLLNQDHIGKYSLNNSLIFSDINNKLLINSNPLNNISSIYQKLSETNNQNIFLCPTFSAGSFNDFAMEFIRNLIRTNDVLYRSICRLNLLNNIPLFDTAPSDGPKSPPSDSSSTTFTLCVAVPPDTDNNISSVYDSLLSTDSLCGISSSENKIKSSILKNSLCSWEINLQNYNQQFKNRLVPSLNYTNVTSKYDVYTTLGYNYIYDFSEKLHLLPPSVLNAPHKSIIDNKLCKYSREILNVPRYEKPLPLNILPLIFLMPSNGTEGIAAAESADESIKEITKGIGDWFNNQRKASQQEVYDRALNTPSYSNYPVGESDKVLLSVSTEGKIWYKLEASIYKYNNTPTIASPKYRYYKLHATSPLDNFSIFSFKNIKSIRDLINKSDIKHSYIDKNDSDYRIFIDNSKYIWDNTSTKIIDDLKYNLKEQINILKQDKEKINNIQKTIDSIGLGIMVGDIVELHNQENESDNGLWSATNPDGFELKKIESFNDLLSNMTFHKNNIGNFIDFETDYDIDKLILMPGLRPYHFFRLITNIITLSNKNISDEDKKKMDRYNEQILEIENLGDTVIYEKQEELKTLRNNIFELTYNQYKNNILNKGYIVIDNKYYTLLYLNNKIEGNKISVLESDSNTITIFNNDISTIKNNDINNPEPINIWEFINKNKPQDIVGAPTSSFSTHGEGNYGWGSNVTRTIGSSNSQDIAATNNTWHTDIIENNNLYKNQYNFIRSTFLYKDKSTNKIKEELTGKEVFLSSTNIYGYSLDDIEQVLEQTKNKKLFISDTDSQKELLNYLKKENKYNTYIQKTQNYSFIDIAMHSDSFNSIKSNTGLISFGDDIQPKILYGFDQDIQENIFSDRLKALEALIKQQYKNIKTADRKYDEDDKTKPSNKDIAIEELKQLVHEQTQIEYYLEKYKTIQEYKYKTDIPNIKIKIIQNIDGSLSFEEKENNNYYWISIDADQGCSIDYDKTPKILYKVRYECVQQNNVTPMDVDQICPKSSLLSSLFGSVEDDEKIDIQGNVIEYTISSKNIKKNIKKYTEKYGDVGFAKDTEGGTFSNYTDQDINYITNRDFFLNGFGDGRNTLIKATYYYIRPEIVEFRLKYPYADQFSTAGNIKNKVRYILGPTWSNKEFGTPGLNESDKLLVDFKRIPRKIKGIDNQYDIYEPNPLGQLSKSIIPSPGGPIDASFKIWRCLDTKTGKYVKPPLYYQWLNEMLFRGHFGSADGVENIGRNSVESKDETAWIPYDYE